MWLIEVVDFTSINKKQNILFCFSWTNTKKTRNEQRVGKDSFCSSRTSNGHSLIQAAGRTDPTLSAVLSGRAGWAGVQVTSADAV